jgi:hypothetical protein
MDLIGEINYANTGAQSRGITLALDNLKLSNYSVIMITSYSAGSPQGCQGYIGVNTESNKHDNTRWETYGSTNTNQQTDSASNWFMRQGSSSTNGDGAFSICYIFNTGSTNKNKSMLVRAFGWRPNAGYLFDSDWLAGFYRVSDIDIRKINVILGDAKYGKLQVFGLRKS